MVSRYCSHDGRRFFSGHYQLLSWFLPLSLRSGDVNHIFSIQELGPRAPADNEGCRFEDARTHKTDTDTHIND